MLTPRDHFYPAFERLIREVATRDRILDVGTYHAFRKELAAFEGELARRRYFAMGYRVRPGQGNARRPDFDGDVCRLPVRDASVDAIICKDVLEHVRDPAAAVREMHRALRPDGLLYCSVPFLHPFHGNPREGLLDCWRFTEDGLDVLFEPFATKEIVRAGGAAFVVKAFTPPPLNRWLFSAPFMPLVNALDRWSLARHATNMFLVLARK